MKKTTNNQISKSIDNIPNKRNHNDRIILHFDYDCFYASVIENANPSLKSQPLGVKQKSILATCNYVARARGVKKLMLISEAQRICPELILVSGEDLTPFRAASKKLWSLLRAHAWSDRVERLGLDEVFLDVSDVVAYNRDMLNPHALGQSFFHLDRQDPVKGFAFDASRFRGCVLPDSDGHVEVNMENPICVDLMLASHLAGHLRQRLDEDFGYTSSSGIATNKVLAKLAGSVHKPNNQTTLLSYSEHAVREFMDAHQLRKIPGIGSRITQLIEEHLHGADRDVTVGRVRRHPDTSPELLDKILDRPGAERGSGTKIWNLLHGVDPSEVKEASDVPTQISIEDTYMSRPLQTPAEVTRELCALATSLIRRMCVDLTEADATTRSTSASNPVLRWLAYPKTLRLSTRTKPKSNSTVPPSTSDSTSTFARSSRSTSLPTFVFTSSPSEEIASRLVTESLLPLFRRLHPERNGGWNLSLLNICVTNMVVVAKASETGTGGTGTAAGGRNIGHMFQTQKDKLRHWTVYDTPEPPEPEPEPEPLCVEGKQLKEATELVNEENDRINHENEDVARPISSLVDDGEGKGDGDDDDVWEEDQEEEPDSQRCEICGHAVPAFAMSAHERFHALDK